MKKGLILTLAMVMAICIGIGATLAYLFVETDSVVNTFEYGDINITLSETPQEYKMIPGNDIKKDPTITVEANSEACWLFVKTEKSSNFNDFMEYEIADGWHILTGVNGVYYREVDATTDDTPFAVLKNNQVSVKNTVTKTMLNDTSFTKPTLTITAYAVQKANVASVEDAWDLVTTKGIPSNS